ncbi:mRNA capping enzyme, alpha subunit [Polychaeton citri CBS 116435]|uniref:mRNA-capping enzyme subunit alpha n=1 Tax=Polychaeton citri CBS 116435 TaxID=1314669 RepID=A0A9P4Q5Z4_9PEZI|nr:mRNA capping enzyme, alpha subunit [Polychaeton citri CBS 116435]
MGSPVDLAKISHLHRLDRDFATLQKQAVADLLHRHNLHFAGGQPVSFSRRHFAEELERTDYFVCEKTDGIRCLLFCTQQVVDADSAPQELYLLIDRKNDYYAVEFGYLHLPTPRGIESFHTGTILDGELIKQRSPDGERLVYLIFDCLCMDSKPTLDRHLEQRLGKVREFVDKPYRNFAKQWPQEVSPQNAVFRIEMKNMQRGYGIMMMFKDVLPRLLHGNDGLIFTCITEEYVAGTDPHILKWKPPHENTIDFRLFIESFPTSADEEGEYEDYWAKPKITIHVNHGNGVYRPHTEPYLALTDEEWENIKKLEEQIDGRIIECFRDPHTHQWRPKIESHNGAPRFRDDKTEANHISTVNSVLESIEDGVTEQELVEHAAKIREAWKRRETQRKQVQDQKQKEQAMQHQQQRQQQHQQQDDDGPTYD